MIFEVKDIRAVFIDGQESSGNVTFTSSIPLCQINLDISSYDPDRLAALEADVTQIIEQSRLQRNESKPDPIAALFCNLDRDFSSGESAISDLDYTKLENARIQEKWRGNRIGKLNELIAGLLPNIELSSAGQMDLIIKDNNNEPSALVEVKNRFNTMNAGSIARLRTEMERLVLHKGSNYFGCEAILAERIPKNDGNEQLFTPSNNATGARFQESNKIKRMGLDQLLSRYDRYAYLRSIIFIAHVMSHNNALPQDYDMSVIFRLLRASLS